ncbi:PPWD1 (predicted) [Pycnogonum litorale]
MTIVHESKEVRAAGLRAIRYYLHDERSVDIFLALHIDLLMCRCIDIVLDNQIERIQALKVIRKIIKVCPMKVTPALVNCITSLANDECQGQEKLIRACLSIISELVVVNTEICAESGCLGVLIHKILDTQQPWINEAMIGVIIYLINLEHTRILIRKCVKVEQILAPFTDLHYRHTIDTNENSLIDDRNIRQTASKLALLSVLRSWPGLIWFSQFDGSNDGVQSLINVLYLDDVDTQIRVMDIMFELFRIPIPESTEDFSSALLSIDPSNHRESWELYKGFVAQEGKDILRNRSKFRMNLVDNYIAVLLMSFVKFGVLDTLVELITKSCLRVCIRATILLAELLYLTCRLLPAECCRHFQALPTLLSLATSLDIPKEQRQQASNAISYLSMVHDLKKRHPVPYSLYLDQQIRFCKNASRRHRSHRPSIGELIRNTKLDSYVKVSDDYINQSIKDSLVLSHRDSSSWDWNIISNTVFKVCFL